tara:strand:+ start:509 stop:1114 length:606 start_codon:yes stop_codon:yes gene_type:complete
MRSIFSFIVEPKEERYNNKKQIGDSELILNTEISDHRYISRNAIVLETPLSEKTDIKKGDEVIVHHNVFRRWYDVRGKEKNSRSFFEDNKYFIETDQIFLYKRKDKWKAPRGFCFVKPLASDNDFDPDKEKPCVGVIKYADNALEKNGIKVGSLVGFTPTSNYEFIVDNERLYRAHTEFITIKYECQGNEVEYNPSWLQSG